MKPSEAYDRYTLEAEANGVTDKIGSSKQIFKVNYNKALDRYCEYLIERKADDENRYIQLLKVIDKEIPKTRSKDNKDIFNIPENYFDFIDISPYASKDSCTNQLFKVKEVKPENINKYLTDIFSEPSFKFRESFYLISENQIILYKDDFEFKKINFSYYRKPQHIELVDEEDPESNFINQEIEFDDKFVNRVITLAVSLHTLNVDDPKFQTLIQQAATKI